MMTSSRQVAARHLRCSCGLAETMAQDDLKRLAALAALDYLGAGAIIGVGSGTTSDHFIAALGTSGIPIAGAVASSEATAQRLKEHGLPVVALGAAAQPSVYVDGADEADGRRRLIKGGGGALTREKVLAAASDRFVCIVDETKLVDRLGAFPLPVEVIPFARAYVVVALTELGGDPVLREGYVTDNGNEILDVRGLVLDDPASLEAQLNQIAGVVSNGLFARRPADILLVGTPGGVKTIL